MGSTDEPDVERANAARMYDYFLGGSHHFAVDRELAEQAKLRSPGMVSAVWAFRDFLRRTVQYCTSEGIDQFLDLGSGIPTVGNVHEVARRINPGARVAYVDCEPVAVAHARHLLSGLSGVTVTQADLADPGCVLAAPSVRESIDLTRPTAILMLAALHFLADTDMVTRVVERYRAALVPGGALVISHGSADFDDPALAARVNAGSEVYACSAQPTHLRTRAEIASWFGELELAEPGLVDIAHWRPNPRVGPTDPIGAYGGVGHMPISHRP